jgi:hypothetical protein
LVFVDDDITVAPDFLRAMVAEFTGAEQVNDDERSDAKLMVVGALTPVVQEPCSVFARAYIGGADAPLPQAGSVAFTECLSGFTAIRRQHFFELGMFQPVTAHGSSVWCDVELAYRADRRGFTFRRCAAAVGEHDDYANRDLATHCRRSERVAEVAVALFAKHPELRPWLPMFRDKGPIAWKEDGPRLILRKSLRQIAASRPATHLMRCAVAPLERYRPESSVLPLLYRWIISGSIFRGYRRGLQAYGRSAVSPPALAGEFKG